MIPAARANVLTGDAAHWRRDVTLVLARTLAVLMLLPAIALITSHVSEPRVPAAATSLVLYSLLVAAAAYARLSSGWRVGFMLIFLAGLGGNIILNRGLGLNAAVIAGMFAMLALLAWGRTAAAAAVTAWAVVFIAASVGVTTGAIEMVPSHGARQVLTSIAGWITFSIMAIVAVSSVIDRLQNGVRQADDLQARLHEEAGQRLALAQRFLAHEEALRADLARELHDDIGQRLTAIKITLETARVRRQNTLTAACRESIRLMQDLGRDMSRSTNLRPTLIDQGGISVAIRRLVREETLRAGLTADVDVPDALRIRDDAQVPCYRIVQEALTNSIRHAGARRIIVRGARAANGVTLIVRDDGVGFDLEAARRLGRAGERLGLLGMRERAEGIGAELDIVSEPGGGTEVRLMVPDEEAA